METSNQSKRFIIANPDQNTYESNGMSSLNPSDYEVNTDNEISSSDDLEQNTSSGSLTRFFNRRNKNSLSEEEDLSTGSAKSWLRRFGHKLKSRKSKSADTNDDTEENSIRLNLIHDEQDINLENDKLSEYSTPKLDYSNNIDSFGIDDSTSELKKKLYNENLANDLMEMFTGMSVNNEDDVFSPETKDSFNMESDSYNIKEIKKFNNISPLTPIENDYQGKPSVKQVEPQSQVLKVLFNIYRELCQEVKILDIENSKINETEDITPLEACKEITSLFNAVVREYKTQLEKTEKLTESNKVINEQLLDLKDKSFKAESQYDTEYNKLENKINYANSELKELTKTNKQMVRELKKLDKIFEELGIDEDSSTNEAKKVDKLYEVLKGIFEGKVKTDKLNDQLRNANYELLKEYRKMKTVYQNEKDKQEDQTIDARTTEFEENIEYLEEQIEQYKQTIDFLQQSNNKRQDNYHSERLKVLDLRKEKNILNYQIQLMECFKKESLQFMSQLMNSFSNCVDSDVLYEYDFYLKNLNNKVNVTVHNNLNDLTIATEVKAIENQVHSFYQDVAKPKFLDQIISKYITSVRSNNFLSDQLEVLEQKHTDQTQYVQRLTQYIKKMKRHKKEKEIHRLANKGT